MLFDMTREHSEPVPKAPKVSEQRGANNEKNPGH
jgi:hypothetical protein